MPTKPADLGKYTAEQLEAMDFRELECLNESWLRALSVPGLIQEEIDAIRLSTRIFIRRREAMRKVAPELLKTLKAFRERIGWESTPSGWATCEICEKAYGFDPPDGCNNPKCLAVIADQLIARAEQRQS